MNWQPIQRPTEVAESRLIAAILTGEFQMNSSLPSERDLAAQLGITRPTSREALQRLARDGWIDIQHGRSTRVRNYWEEGNLGVLEGLARHPEHAPADFVPNLLQVRQLLAPTYARLAVARRAAAVCALLADYANLTDTPDYLAKADWELHRRLTILSGNPIFTLILNGFGELYQQMAVVYFSLPASRESSRAYYARLLTAAQAGDAAAAEQYTTAAVTESLQLWRRAMYSAALPPTGGKR